MPRSVVTLDEDGAQHFPGCFSSATMTTLEARLGDVDTGRAGIRISAAPRLVDWLAEAGVTELVSDRMASHARPVRSILFDKTADANWALGWHQDRTIVVTRRAEVDGFGRWSRKRGLTHVEPPFSIIEAMITARIHLDPAPIDNAPLLIAPGSHRAGRISESEIGAVAAQCGTFTCLAGRGDLWLYRTAIVHRSAATTSLGRRRVLQVDFSAEVLPEPLQWLGLAEL